MKPKSDADNTQQEQARQKWWDDLVRVLIILSFLLCLGIVIYANRSFKIEP